MEKDLEEQVNRELCEQEVGNVPAYMRDSETLGTEDLAKFVIPPRVKVLQKLSDQMLLDKFNVGDTVIVPQQVLIAPIVDEVGTPFNFVPILFFPEWCLWNPLKMKGALPAIRERSLDPTSELAVRAKDPNLWRAPCPENLKEEMRYVEHLNFIIMVLNNEQLAGLPIILSFSRGDHRFGSNFAALIKMRKAPLFGCHFEARIGLRTNVQGSWYGLDVTNPSRESGITPFVANEELFEVYKGMYIELKAAHDASKIRVQYEETQSPEPADSPSEF